MKSKTISISLFLPTYNEEANIESSVLAANAVLQRITDTYEIIVVNDGSTDRTQTIAEQMARTHPHIRVVNHQKNKGYGAALRTGIQSARYDYVFFTDADLQFDLSELAILVHFVPEYKVVLGYRAPRRDPLLRRINAGMWNMVNRFVFGLKVKDIDCAFKLIDRALLVSIPLKTSGAMLSAEMLIRLQRRGVVFKEVPVSHFPREQGVATGANPTVIVRALRELRLLYQSRFANVKREQLERFIIVGMVNTLFDISLYTYLIYNTALFFDHLVIAKICSFIAGTVSSFLLNRYWTFKKTTRLQISEVVHFYFTVAGGLVLNLLSMVFFLSVIPVTPILAAVFANIITLIWNLIVMKLWVYTANEIPKRPLIVPKPLRSKKLGITPSIIK